jgi:succinate dehydrogenase/fumarate reductase flavoprotein subunit
LGDKQKMGEMPRPAQLSCDVLIVGGGGAGMCAAIEARKAGKDVLVVSKARVGYGNNTFLSAGAFSASGWGDRKDNSQRHLKDTLYSGRFINNPRLSGNFVELAHEQVPFLESCGVAFNSKDDAVRVGLAPGHSIPRNVWTKNSKGSGFMLPLIDTARKTGVRFLDNTLISKLFVQHHKICGAAGVNAAGSLVKITAPAVILTTGGFARIYDRNNNAPGISGSGHALAYELGLPLRDMEFVQFYPTYGTLYEVTVVRFGVKLRNALNEDILEKYRMTDVSSITRDKLARAVFMEIKDGLGVDGGIVLDTGHIPEGRLNRIKGFFPKKKEGGKSSMIVGPTAHFCMGGVVVDDSAMTDVDGLFAAGEVCGGAHGANRLGGNALAEVFAMGRQAGKNASEYAGRQGLVELKSALFTEEENRLINFGAGGGEDFRSLRSSLKKIMWQNAGIIRDRQGLENAVSTIMDIRHQLQRSSARTARAILVRLELEAMLTVSEAVCRSALMRQESRGAHYRLDYPEEDNGNWLKNIFVQKKKSDMGISAVSVDREILSKLEIEPERDITKEC